MMKKTGAGLLLSRLGVFLLGACVSGWGGSVSAQEAAEPAAEKPAPGFSFSQANTQAAARLDSVKGKTADELRELLKATNESLPVLNKAASERNAELDAARNVADREAPEIRELYKTIEQLQVKIAAVTDTLPGVREKVEAYAAAQSALFEEMQFRTKLLGLISAKEASEPTSEKGTETP